MEFEAAFTLDVAALLCYNQINSIEYNTKQHCIYDSHVSSQSGKEIFMSSSKNSLKTQIYDAIKHRIVYCEYTPGMHLNEDLLCQQFGVSRTPVRDALSRLELEGLVSIHSKRGLVINSVSLRSVNELYEARLRIEPYAVKNYGCKLSDDVYAEYVELFSKTDLNKNDLYELDDRFHCCFIEASQNRFLSLIYGITADQSARCRILSDVGDRIILSQQEHYEIATNCLLRNWSKAAESMRIHLEESKNAIIRYVLNQNLSSSNIFEQYHGAPSDDAN